MTRPSIKFVNSLTSEELEALLQKFAMPEHVWDCSNIWAEQPVCCGLGDCNRCLFPSTHNLTSK